MLIEVKAAAINPCDFKFRRAPLPWPLSVKPKPYGKIPGQDVAGVVVKVDLHNHHASITYANETYYFNIVFIIVIIFDLLLTIRTVPLYFVACFAPVQF